MNGNANVQIDKKTVYSPLSPTPEETAAQVQYTEGELSHPELVNKTIEDRALRSTIPEGEGNISITVLPGSKLGELSVNVQFEGKAGEYNYCMSEHNALLVNVSEWLSDLLSQIETDFVVSIEGKPCPKTVVRLMVREAALVLNREARLEKKVDNGGSGRLVFQQGDITIKI